MHIQYQTYTHHITHVCWLHEEGARREQVQLNAAVSSVVLIFFSSLRSLLFRVVVLRGGSPHFSAIGAVSFIQ